MMTARSRRWPNHPADRQSHPWPVPAQPALVERLSCTPPPSGLFGKSRDGSDVVNHVQTNGAATHLNAHDAR